MSNPTLSVVIPTFNGGRSVVRLVEALRSPEGVSVEVVIVDDASTDDTWERLSALATSPPPGVEIRPIRQQRNGGPAAARNAGWRSARAPLIAFTDDDCRPSPEWLGSIVAALDDVDLVQGKTVPDPEQVDHRGAFSHWIEVTSENGHYETCNMAYRREVLEAIDGFDETFRQAFGEDLDAARRALALGYRSTFRPDALVLHDVTRSDWRAYIHRKRRRFDFVLLCRRYPDLRRELSFGMFSHPTAIAIGLLLVMITVRRRSPVAWAVLAALVAKYSINTVTTAPPPRRPYGWVGVLPVRLVGDWYDVLVMARASLHHRSLVL